jgi:hypothetical protein
MEKFKKIFCLFLAVVIVIGIGMAIFRVAFAIATFLILIAVGGIVYSIGAWLLRK